MSSMWTVTPDVVERIELEYLGTPFWIEVKKDLTFGERRRVDTAGFKSLRSDNTPVRPGEPERPTEINTDFAAISLARTMAYLVDWSLTDDKGNKLPLEPQSRKRDTIEALHTDVAAVIEEAINKHIERRAEEKKLTAGASKPRAISA